MVGIEMAHKDSIKPDFITSCKQPLVFPFSQIVFKLLFGPPSTSMRFC
jgi:hypothetical protein